MGELSEVPPPSRPRRMLDRLDAQRWPLALAVLVSGWNLWDLRATLRPVAYPDDASIHEQMVRFATAAVQAGHDPLGQWFPYLGAGSPQFLHYQSLGAMLTGVAGALVGGDTAFRWSLYLLVALWPLVIYLSPRLLRLTPWAAAAASVLSPVLMSVPSVGYEAAPTSGSATASGRSSGPRGSSRSPGRRPGGRWRIVGSSPRQRCPWH